MHIPCVYQFAKKHTIGTGVGVCVRAHVHAYLHACTCACVCVCVRARLALEDQGDPRRENRLYGEESNQMENKRQACVVCVFIKTSPAPPAAYNMSALH